MISLLQAVLLERLLDERAQHVAVLLCEDLFDLRAVHDEQRLLREHLLVPPQDARPLLKAPVALLPVLLLQKRKPKFAYRCLEALQLRILRAHPPENQLECMLRVARFYALQLSRDLLLQIALIAQMLGARRVQLRCGSPELLQGYSLRSEGFIYRLQHIVCSPILLHQNRHQVTILCTQFFHEMKVSFQWRKLA